jgi:hypothetical protein
MPEQITKYPDVTLKVLKSAGAACGTGTPQKILTQCPAERFCALPGGEMCIYGLDQIPQMTQIKMHELAGAAGRPPVATDVTGMEALAVGAVFVAGVVFGRYWPRARK